jgi:Fe-S cluster assembly iron-binding protein IscA
MALDEPKDGDEVMNEKGLTFLVEKELLSRTQPIAIDFVESAMGGGFTVTSALSGQSGCGGGTCSC